MCVFELVSFLNCKININKNNCFEGRMNKQQKQLATGCVALLGYVYAANICLKKKRKTRRWQVRPINRGVYEEKGQYQYFLQMKLEDPEQFFRYTRMDRESYDYILQVITPKLRKNHLRAIPVDMKLAITLQYLTQGTSFVKEGWSFHIGPCTVGNIVEEVCDVIISEMMNPCLPRPTKEDWIKIAQGFHERWNVPNCIGAVDGKHIQIQAPINSGSQYFNYKRTFSMVMMAIVDHDYQFIIVDVGSFGSESDGGIFADTQFGQGVINETLWQQFDVPQQGRPLPGTSVITPYYVIGDDAFPLKNNLMKPYAGKNLPEKEETCNYRFSRARRIVENVFGIVAARFRIFRSTVIVSAKKLEKFTMAAVILHNFLMKRSTRYNSPGLVDEENSDGTITFGSYRNEIHDGDSFRPCRMFGSRNSKKSAYDMREQLANYFISPDGALPWQRDYIRRGRLQK